MADIGRLTRAFPGQHDIHHDRFAQITRIDRKLEDQYRDMFDARIEITAIFVMRPPIREMTIINPYEVDDFVVTEDSDSHPVLNISGSVDEVLHSRKIEEISFTVEAFEFGYFNLGDVLWIKTHLKL